MTHALLILIRCAADFNQRNLKPQRQAVWASAIRVPSGPIDAEVRTRRIVCAKAKRPCACDVLSSALGKYAIADPDPLMRRPEACWDGPRFDYDIPVERVSNIVLDPAEGVD